jgi:hypothetical protein
MMGRRHIFFINILFILCAGAMDARAQVSPVDSLINAGDSLRRVYCFEQSLAEYNKALEMVSDTASVWRDSSMVMKISDLILLSENGRNMTGFVYKPEVVARHKFSKVDFFLSLKTSAGSKAAALLPIISESILEDASRLRI